MLVRQIMRDEDLVPCQRRPFGTMAEADAKAAAAIPDSVNRNFSAEARGIKFVGDITDLHTWEGFTYLATLIDCYSKKVVGFFVTDHMRTALVDTALSKNAAATTHIAREAIWHSRRGSQGGFNWSSRHLDSGGVDGQDRRMLGQQYGRKFFLSPEERARLPHRLCREKPD